MKFRLPLMVKMAGLVLGTTALYTYIGQLVPQKQVLPPEVIVMADTMTTDELVGVGRTIFEGKGLCQTCHTVGNPRPGMRFPDLAGIGERAGRRIDGMDALAYLAHSLYRPNEYVVEGFAPGMPEIDKPPIALTDQEIKAVIAYLQSLGGTPTVTLQTEFGLERGG
jgi:mono/diheme cytochrome c family protein